MNKAALTTAILTSLLSGTTLAATVYDADGTTLQVSGRAEARFNISDANKSDSDNTGDFKDKTRARLALKGKTQINTDLYGFGKYEAEFEKSDSLTNRYFFAGLGTQLGEFSYGKQDSAQVMITNFTDIMATFGAEAADVVNGNKDKRENNFVYSGKFAALTVKANYIAADKDNTKDTQSYGIAAKYALDMFSVGAGYVAQKEGDDNNNQFNLGGELKLNALTLGALATFGAVADDDYTGYELSAQYKATHALSFAAVYNYGKYDDSNDKTADNLAVEAVYKFNSNLRTYAGYKFEQLADGDDQLQAGMRYDF